MKHGGTGAFQVFGTADVPERMRGAVVAIGNFDGVHRGHQAVLGHATSIAAERGLRACALTFEPHPRTHFVPDKPIFRLSPRVAKRRLFQAVGLDGCVEMDFNKELAGVEAKDFISGIMCSRLAASHVVVGFDFHFGKGRRGSPEMLAEAGPRCGFDVTVEEAHGDEGGSVFSSSAIRSLLDAGEVEAADEVLGYHWFVTGEVIHGEKRGRDLGFPTANIRLAPECGLRHGIYAVLGRFGGRMVPGVASFGRRPQFDNGAPLLEPYFFDFNENLYGREIDVVLVSFLRDEAKFDSVETLVEQMHRDVGKAREKLAGVSLTPIDRSLAATAPGTAG